MKMDYLRLFPILFILCQVSGVENANILAIHPMVQKSHFVMFKRLYDELARRGHNVDVLGGIQPSDGTPIQGMTFIEFPELKNFSVPRFTIHDQRKFTVNFEVKFMFPIAANTICSESFSTDVMKNLRDSKKKYDLLFLEIFVCDCFFGFAHTFKVPVVSLISSTDLPWGGKRIGNPDNPSYIPIYFQGYRPDKFFYDRFWNTVSYLQTKMDHWWYIQEQTRISREFFGKDMPDLNDIVANVSLLLINSHFTLNIPRPTVPNFIEVGGLHIDSPKVVNKAITDFIGEEKFIYFSLGSVANSETLEIDILKSFVDAFSGMKYKIMWKANDTEISNTIRLPSNVLINPWLPQLELLCHPNIVLFITHAGLLGTQEAIHCGVPMLCIPLFADQYQNCQNIVENNVAKTFILETVTKDDISGTVKEIIESPRYKLNALMMSKRFKDRPMPPLETAVYWVEYVLRHNGAPQLKSLSISLEWYQYYLVDVFCVILLFIILSLGTCYILLKMILTKLKNVFEGRNDSKLKKNS